MHIIVPLWWLVVFCTNACSLPPPCNTKSRNLPAGVLLSTWVHVRGKVGLASSQILIHFWCSFWNVSISWKWKPRKVFNSGCRGRGWTQQQSTVCRYSEISWSAAQLYNHLVSAQGNSDTPSKLLSLPLLDDHKNYLI